MQTVHYCGNLASGYQPGTLKLSGGILVMGAPQEILVVKINGRIIPAAVTAMAAEDPPGGVEFAGWETESAD